MKKALNAWSVDDNAGFNAMFEQLKKAGFDGVELNLDAPGRSAHSLSLETTDSELAEIMNISEKYDLPVISVSSSLYGGGMGSPCPDERAQIKKILEKQLYCANQLGAGAILVVPGGISAETSIKEAYKNSLETLRDCLEFIEEYKIAVGVENVWNQFFTSPWDMAVFIDNLNSQYIKAYFDVGNVLAFSYPEYWIEILGSRISRVHIKNFLRNGHFNLGGSFVDLAVGSARWPEIIAALRNVGYDGYLTAEVEKREGLGFEEFYEETVGVIRGLIGG